MCSRSRASEEAAPCCSLLQKKKIEKGQSDKWQIKGGKERKRVKRWWKRFICGWQVENEAAETRNLLWCGSARLLHQWQRVRVQQEGRRVAMEWEAVFFFSCFPSPPLPSPEWKSERASLQIRLEKPRGMQAGGAKLEECKGVEEKGGLWLRRREAIKQIRTAHRWERGRDGKRGRERDRERGVVTSGRVTAKAMWQVGAAQQWSGGLIGIINLKGRRQTRLLVFVYDNNDDNNNHHQLH